jgi:hypothetical protein
MDIDTINGIPVETERYLGHSANSQALSPTGGIIPEQIQPVVVVDVVTSSPIHEHIDTPPEKRPTIVTGTANDSQMDVDDDMEELYWDPPSRLGTPMIHVPSADEMQQPRSPIFGGLSTAGAALSQPASQHQQNSLGHNATGLDQLLTTHIRVRHANSENPWKSLLCRTLLEKKRKPYRKPKSNRSEMCINTQNLMTFSLAEWICKEQASY